jgi:hypothetical protein
MYDFDIMSEMSSVCDNTWSRDYHNDTGSRIPWFGNTIARALDMVGRPREI